MTLILIFVFSAYEKSNAEEASRSLVVYFSWSGNTEALANEIQTQTGADIFELIPAEPYTNDYNTLLDIAKNEKAKNSRPAIAKKIQNFEQYQIIYLGFPNWWADMPMILYTFLDEYDCSGKIIAPFVISGGSGLSNTINLIKALEPNAKVLDGLSLRSSKAAHSDADVAKWLSSLGMK